MIISQRTGPGSFWEVAKARVEGFAPDAPTALQNEAVRRFAGYLNLSGSGTEKGSGFGVMRTLKVGDADTVVQDQSCTRLSEFRGRGFDLPLQGAPGGADMKWRFWRSKPETRERDYTSLLTSLYEAAAHTGVADVTSTAAVEAAAGFLSRALASGEIQGPEWAKRAINARTLGQIGRDLVLNGSSTHVIEVDNRGRVILLPATNIAFQSGGPDPRTWSAFVTMNGPGESVSRLIPWDGLIWVPWGTSPQRPYSGVGPTSWASITSKLLAETERSLRDESGGPIAQILPVPRYDEPDPDTDPDEDATDPAAGLRSDIKKARGRALLTETTGAGWGEGKASAPQSDWKAHRLGPMPPESMIALRRQTFDSVLASCGTPPPLFTDSDGTSQREALRRWHMNLVLPCARILEQELSEKLEVDIKIKLDAYPRDQVGRAQVVARLTNAGINIDTALMAAGLSGENGS